ncbi:MAG: tetratricopeptide repeat protein [Mucilaginibacter sp.]|uniref:tetratricopeptide repeat protein n=1 Tax=Mucilaginibacter sp. TaxID=1882438 RepID=UPI0034E37BDC
MKLFLSLLFSCLFLTAVAQSDDVLLARQYAASGEKDKASQLYQKLYKQDNETYFKPYCYSLLSLKKLDEAESLAKKMIKKHPGNVDYTIMLANIYTEKGEAPKAEAVYKDILKNLPADEGQISMIANQLYQAGNTDYTIRVFLQGRALLHNDQLFSMPLISMYRFRREKMQMAAEYLNILTSNPDYLYQAQNNIANQFDGPADYETFKGLLLDKIQKNPQAIVFTQLLTWQYLQQKEYELALNQVIALSKRQKDNGEQVFQLCQMLNSNEAYDAAIRGYEFVISKGKEREYYIPARIEILNTKNLKVTSGKYQQQDLVSLEKDYQDLLTEFGRNSNTAFAMQKLARLEAFKLHKTAEAEKLLEQAVQIPDLQQNLLADCKMDLGDVYLLNNEPWEATLLYSQVEKGFPNTNIAQEAKYRNAHLAYFTGDFTWAKAQLDVLKAATSQLIANDALNLSLLITDNTAFDSTGNALKMYARADFLIYKEQTDRALKTLDSIDRVYPNNTLADDILMAKARIFIQQKQYVAALTPLQKIVADHPTELWADDAVFMMADLYENRLNDKAKAQQLYQKIITDYPSSLWISEARKKFRALRGDAVPSS